MTAKTRYFLFGSALVLVVGLSIGVVAYYGGGASTLFGAGPGPDELRYIPRDAAVVAYADVRQVMTSELRQRLRQMPGQSDEGRQEFRDKTGIDIERDIDRVVACMEPHAAEGDSAQGLVVARGRFDVARIEGLARENGAAIETYKGKRLMTHVAHRQHESAEEQARKGEPEPELAVAFIEPGLVALGSVAAVRGAVDLASGGENVTDNADMMKFVTEMDDGSVWAVGRFDAIASQAHLPEDVTSRIPPITWFAASGRVNGGMHAVIKAEARDEQAANNLRDIVRGFIALAKMQTGNKPEAAALWPAIEMGGTGTEVSISFAVSSALLDAIGSAHRQAPRKITIEPKKGVGG